MAFRLLLFTESNTLPSGAQLEDWDIPSDYSRNSVDVADTDGDGKGNGSLVCNLQHSESARQASLL